ncbi:MAG TPA: class I SAM-dependent methyltransferase [Pyrinomonadaceae bacterium]
MPSTVEYNSAAWDKCSESKDQWTVPVDSFVIEEARRGRWSVRLTPFRSVPPNWFGDNVIAKDVLCLASGGGQQAPILAAAGANVTSFDNSARQLQADQFVAERDELKIDLQQGDAADLSRFESESFDLIFHPCSNLFIPRLQPVWDECFRVLRRGGRLLVGFTKPEIFIFDQFEEDRSGDLIVKYSLPYSDEGSLSPDELNVFLKEQRPLEFSHTLEEQIGGQALAGFYIIDLFEDKWNDPNRTIDRYMSAFVATLATKPK